MHYRIDERTRLIGMLSYNHYRDSGAAYQTEFGAVGEYRFTDWFSGRIGYRHGQATDGGSFFEDRLLLEQTIRVFLPSKVTVDFRTRGDFRWLNSGFSVRLRERVQVQRDFAIGDYVFQPYGSAELYFDTRYDQVSRFRLILGASFPLGRRFAVEPYIAHQVDVVPTTTITDALGLVFHVMF